MKLEDAQALAIQIEREAPGTTATVKPDELYSSSYFLEVHKQNVVRMCIRSISQWNERKHLLQKYDRGEN